MTPRLKRWLLIALLAAGLAYRLCAAYPLQLERFAPASSALQAMHIAGGARPIFYSGQAWMGPAGAYVIAGLFKLFGASTLTLGAFSWLMSGLFLLGAVLLAHRLFGIDNALVGAALFLVPVDYLMHLSGQPRAHYTVCFVLAPAVFLAALSVLGRHRAGGSVTLRALLFGVLCGASFWTNMAIGPAIAVAMLLLLGHLRRSFFTRVLVPWLAGWLVGFWPVIWYNLTSRAVLAGQVNADNTRRLGRVLAAFVANAWPRFWGVDLSRVGGPVLRAALVALVAWIGVLFLWALVEGLRRWSRGEDVVGHQLVFGYFALHLAVTASSSYGNRFETDTPLSYVGPLYAVAFCVPGLVLQSRIPRAAKALALLPLGLFVANNVAANAYYTRTFAAAIREQGLGRVTRYPNLENPVVRICRERGLEAGYLGRTLRADDAKFQNFLLNLEGFGVATFADCASERYVASALAADAARDFFWVQADRNSLRMIDAASREDRVQKFVLHSEFRKEMRETTVIAVRPAEGADDRQGAGAVTDRHFDTSWTAGSGEGAGSVLEFAFAGPEPLREVVIFPQDASLSPRAVSVELSDDGLGWRTAALVSDAQPMFWSVRHPFLKAVKPRMEIALPAAQTARFCRLRFTRQRNPPGPVIREVLFLRDGPAIAPEAWEQEIQAVVRTAREQGRGAVVAADHWFAAYFRQEGFATDFISNDSIDDNGTRNPNLAAPVPLDLSRPHLLIVPREHLPAVEALLARRGVACSRTDLRFHALCLTRPARVDPPLYWNGLELNELARRD